MCNDQSPGRGSTDDAVPLVLNTIRMTWEFSIMKSCRALASPVGVDDANLSGP